MLWKQDCPEKMYENQQKKQNKDDSGDKQDRLGSLLRHAKRQWGLRNFVFIG